jgi:hypothetical protein
MAAGATFEPIATTTLGSAAASVTFSSIPSTYTDLVLVCEGYMATQDGSVVRIQFNSDTGNNYSSTYVGGNGSTASSSRYTNVPGIYATTGLIGWSTTSSNRGNTISHIMNYTNTTTYKTVLDRSNLTAGSYPGSAADVGLWRSTAAITSIKVDTNGGTFASGSTFTLYGIAAA